MPEDFATPVPSPVIQAGDTWHLPEPEPEPEPFIIKPWSGLTVGDCPPENGVIVSDHADDGFIPDEDIERKRAEDFDPEG